jgi:two-component system, OmpR family, alkaline phosphatase synthesis response regulator PhoP
MSLQKKILVIEDNADLMMMVASRLESNDYTVIKAVNAEEGFIKIKEEHPDLIVLDLMLPGMNGYEMCANLKLDQKISTPIIMLTSRIRGIDIQLGYKCGADRYIPKPYGSERLLLEIEEILQPKETVHTSL